MSWDSKLDAVLTAADDSVAKIKERLYTRGDTSRDFCYDSTVRRSVQYEYWSEMKPASPCAPSAYTHPAAVSSEDMVNLSSQLLSQAKMITSLHQAIGRLERDRDLHIQRIQSLEDEVQRLAASRGLDVTESVLQRKMDGMRQELSSELCHLEARVRDSTTCASSPSLRSAVSISQEMNETKRLMCKEFESLRRDSDYTRQRLRRQEDDLRQHITDGQELLRTQEKHGAALERIQSSHQVQTQELERARSDTQRAQREIVQLRSAMGDLLDDVRILEGKVHRASSAQPDHRYCRQSRELSRFVSTSSADDDFSEISLADISSEDTSYSLGAAATVSRESREKSSTSKEGRIQSNHDLSDQDLGELSDSAPELNFSDL
ncbi:coiled-coil domain-containing protein 159 isoform X2 [Ranitomeya variabilis]|uniref:coiled-coil domain-containing protein 159 isoform X2 n=1 Tax=Ranitomeya variabilis TaxID=490064 RepID=UPI00405722AF